MVRIQKVTALVAAIANTCVDPATAFAPPRTAAFIPGAPKISSRNNDGVYCPPLSAAGPPVINNWRYESSKGTISGTVTNHPTIRDGDRITTSPVKNPEGVNENLLVQTKSGSKYKLSSVAFGGRIPAVEAKRAKEKEAAAKKDAEAKAAAVTEKKRIAKEKKEAAEAARNVAAEAKRAGAAVTPKRSAQKKEKKVPAPKVAPKAASRAQPTSSTQQIDPAALRKLAKSTFSLTGATVGDDGKYLLAGKPRQSQGRAAKIWTAYVADPALPEVPAGFDGTGSASRIKQLTVKLSPDIDRLRLENSNYDKVQSGLFSGRFVKKMDYVAYVPSNKRDLDRKVSALVIESGKYDLKALLAARNGSPLRGRALRDAAASAGQCIQAVHSSGLVWTDLKTENFVVVMDDNNFDKEVGDSDGKMGLPGVKGIDLESVVARGGNPIDYSPEACPPEFAQAFMGGYGESFKLDYSYDIWSLGMMLYELSTGQPYFDKKTPNVVTRQLCSDDFEVDVGDVPDANLRDLIGKCLSLEPGRRPDITGFLLHPYFITTGFGPFSF